MNKALQKAIDCLKIQDVYLYSTIASISDGFEPKYDTDIENLQIQFKHVVTHSDVLALDEDGKKTQIFRVFIELGARWVLPPKNVEENSDESGYKAMVEGRMVAEYKMQEDPGPEALKEFALKNASYHIWPYWREYLVSQCMRMNLPKAVLPAVQLAKNKDSD